jgi:predicted transcriptional regulator
MASREAVVKDLRDLSLSMHDIRKKNRISLSTLYNIAREFDVDVKERNKILFLLHKRKQLEVEIRALNKHFQSHIKEL